MRTRIFKNESLLNKKEKKISSHVIFENLFALVQNGLYLNNCTIFKYFQVVSLIFARKIINQIDLF